VKSPLDGFDFWKFRHFVYTKTMELGLTILGVVLVVIGLAGTVVPGLPGLPLMFLGFLARSAATDFASPSALMLIVGGGIILLYTLVHVLTAPLATKALGGTTGGMVGAGVGLLVGLLFSFS